MADSTKKKNYVKGSAKQHVFDNGGDVIHLDLKIEGIIIGSTGPIKPNDAGFAKVTVSKLKEPDQYGNTHCVYENDWVPTEKRKAAPKPKTPVKPREKDDDLPF